MDDLFEHLKQSESALETGLSSSLDTTTRTRDFIVRIERRRLENVGIQTNVSISMESSPQAYPNNTTKRNSNEDTNALAKRQRNETDDHNEHNEELRTTNTEAPIEVRGRCVVRMKKDNLEELRDYHEMQAKRKRENSQQKSPMPKKRGRPRKSDQASSSSAAATTPKTKKTTTPTKASTLSRSTLIQQYGKRFFHSYVKIERCRHALMESERGAAKLKGSKNLSVSFCDHVEIMSTTNTNEDAAKIAATPQRSDVTEADGLVAEMSFNEEPTEQKPRASTPLRSPKKLLTPLKDEATPSPRKQELKKADEKLPPNGLRALKVYDDDEEMEVAECIDTGTAEEVDDLKVNITTVAEIHQNPGETEENGKIATENQGVDPNEITPNDSSCDDNTDKTLSPSKTPDDCSSPTKSGILVEKSDGHDDELPPVAESTSTIAVSAQTAAHASSLPNEDENSTSSFASAEGQPHLDDESAIDTIRSFIDEKSNTEDAQALDDTNDAPLPEALSGSAAQFGLVTASPRPALHSFENKLHAQGKDVEELSNGESECLHLFVDDDELKIVKDDTESLQNISPALAVEEEPEQKPVGVVVSDYDAEDDVEIKHFEELLTDEEGVNVATEPDV